MINRMWHLHVYLLLLISFNATRGSPQSTKEFNDLCGTENWTSVDLKIIRDENDIKRITSNKCAIVLQNPPSGKLTKAVISLLPKQSLKILQVTGNVSWIDDEGMASLKHLKLLRLSDVNLKDSEVVAGQGGFAKQVESIDLSQNGLKSLEFLKTESKNVRRLNLENNVLSTVPEELEVFDKLEDLNMSRNKIMDISVKSTFIFVQKLDLSQNMISNFSGLHYFLNVEILHLEHNRINDIRNEYSENERGYLAELYLDSNFIEVLPIRILFNLPNLKTLSLSNNNVRKLIPTTDKRYRQTNLEYLNLGHNSLDEIPYNFLKWFPFLKTFKINNNKLALLRTGTFANLNNLVNLDLSNNEIVTLDAKRFIPLESLIVLNISHNKIESIDYFSLVLHVPSLKTVNIDQNYLLCENLVEMLKFFPNNAVEVEEGHCEGREHIRRICCVDTAKNYSDSKFNMASYSVMTQNKENSKKLDELLETIKNLSNVYHQSDSDQDESIVITKLTFWTGVGIIIAALFLILIVLIIGLVMKRREVLPVHL